MAPSDDPEWQATLAAAVARAEAADAAELEQERADPAAAFDRKRSEREQIKSAAAHELTKASVPPIHVDELRADRVLETAAIAKVRQWKRTRSWLLLMRSDFGVGKDFAFAWSLWLDAVARAEARRGTLVDAPKCWYSAAGLQRVGNYDQAEFDRIANLPTLVIADLGGEHHNGAWLSLLGDLLDHRFSHHKRTLISSNLKGRQKDDPPEKVSELRAWIGDRIATRVNAGGVISGVTGPDLRQLGFNGMHGLSLVGADVRPHHEPEEREGRLVVRSSAYRIRMPKACAVRNRNQMMFAFALSH